MSVGGRLSIGWLKALPPNSIFGNGRGEIMKWLVEVVVKIYTDAIWRNVRD